MGQPAGPPTSPTLIAALACPANDGAWRLFVRDYEPLIRRHCRRAGLRDADAEEVRSLVFLKLVPALAGFRYDPARTFRGYLAAVVRNAVSDYRRDQTRPGATGRGGDGPCPLDRLPDLAGELDDAIFDRLERMTAALARVRASVGDGVWRAYWLTAAEGRSAREAAAELGTTAGAVYTARYRVGRLLAAEGGP